MGALGRFISVRTFWLGLAVGVLVLFCLWPFLKLFTTILFSGADGSFTVQPFADVLSGEAVARALRNTLLVSTLVTVACLAAGVPLAWILTRTDFPCAVRFRSWLCLPFAIPPYIGAIAWIYLANPATGLINTVIGTGSVNVYSMAGLVFVEASFLYTFILMTALSSLDRMDSSLEEAARLSGASPLRVFRDVGLPLMRPALVSGSILVFLATAASFGVPALIGGPARIYLLTTQIYTFQKMGSMSGLIKAGALSSLLMAGALGILLCGHYLVSRGVKTPTVSGKTSRPSVIELRRLKWPVFGAVAIFLSGVFVLPITGILISSLSEVQGALALDNITAANWNRVFFEVDETGRAVFNSLVLSFSAATAACVLGLFIGYVSVKTRVPGRGWLDTIAGLPYAAPGTVVALAMILAFGQSFLGLLPSLYNTLALIGIAYVTKYLSFAIKTVSDGYRQVDDVLDEAARVSGATWSQAMRTVWLPLLKSSLIAAWFLVFMSVMSELTMTILLTGPGLETIGTLIFQLQEYADASGGGASVLALVVVVLVILFNSAVKRLSRGKYGL